MNITNGLDPIFLLDRQTVDETTSKPIQVVGAMRDVCVTYTSEGTTSSGNMIIEESDFPSYTGTWSQVHSQAASALTGGAKLCVHVQFGAGGWYRVRINTAIGGGGTMTATLSGA